MMDGVPTGVFVKLVLVADKPFIRHVCGLLSHNADAFGAPAGAKQTKGGKAPPAKKKRTGPKRSRRADFGDQDDEFDKDAPVFAPLNSKQIALSGDRDPNRAPNISS